MQPDIKIPQKVWTTYGAIANASGFDGWSANDNYNKQRWPGITPEQRRVLSDAFCALTGDTRPVTGLSKASVERWLNGEKVLMCYAQTAIVERARAAFVRGK